MRKIFLFMMTTVDGYFEGPNCELSWHNVNAEFNAFAVEQLNEVDLLLFGRKTYDLMASVWPTEKGKGADPITAGKMNNTNKIVFSHTLGALEWEHTELRTSVDAEEIKKLKEQQGKDIAIFGSSNLCISFLRAGLLDEIRIMINPVLLGKGHTLFQGLEEEIQLQLINSRSFNSGNMLLSYKVIK
jgi:dihydrofolate reductase